VPLAAPPRPAAIQFRGDLESEFTHLSLIACSLGGHLVPGPLHHHQPCCGGTCCPRSAVRPTAAVPPPPPRKKPGTGCRTLIGPRSQVLFSSSSAAAAVAYRSISSAPAAWGPTPSAGPSSWSGWTRPAARPPAPANSWRPTAKEKKAETI